MGDRRKREKGDGGVVRPKAGQVAKEERGGREGGGPSPDSKQCTHMLLNRMSMRKTSSRERKMLRKLMLGSPSSSCLASSTLGSTVLLEAAIFSRIRTASSSRPRDASQRGDSGISLQGRVPA